MKQKMPNNLGGFPELKSLRNLHSYVESSYLLRVEGRFKKADLPLDTKHPLILISSGFKTRLIVIQEHVEAGNAGLSYFFMRMRSRYF